MKIQSREQADRLARAICADIALYNEAALQNDPSGGMVQEALREGMLLYLSRAPLFPEAFLEAVESIIFSRLAVEHRDALRMVLDKAAREAPSVPVEASPAPAASVKARRRDSGDGVSVALLGLVVLAVAIAVALLMK